MVTPSVDIVDQTTYEGLTKQTTDMWRTMVTAADAVGLDRIEIIAGAGGGHLSHAKGTEIDVRGWNADGSRWTTRQRLAVAVAAAAAGGNRFGFYTQNGSPTALHVGLGASGIPRYVAWGPGMAVSDVDVSLFASEERAFVSALRNGNIEDYQKQTHSHELAYPQVLDRF